jgi:predicted lipid carrier protein YhbT
MNKSASTGTSPELPSVAAKPLSWVPLPVKAQAISRALNALFATPLQAGELEFLAERVMNIFVSDAELRFSVRLNKGRLCAGSEVPEADLTIEGTVYTFLLLATRKEDADTLFFRRQLKTSGDTELGEPSTPYCAKVCGLRTGSTRFAVDYRVRDPSPIRAYTYISQRPAGK